MVWRLVMTMIVIAMRWSASFMLNVPRTLVTGQVAGQQFDNSDMSYLTTQAVFGGFSAAELITDGLVFLILLAIWIGPISSPR